MLTRILVPIDLAEPQMTKLAIDYAETLAKAFHSEIRLVNVQSLTPIKFLDYLPQDFDENIKRGLEGELASVAAHLSLPPTHVTTALLFGPIYQTIIEEAERWKSDLIVLCSHRPGMDRFLIGSNANAVTRHATCPVLIVR
ncbi:universal stress protein [Methylocystis parvus]|uniref:universal stress protein n=1 Tax=Methylocystis parvus TaxID=134 RepID=UPI003C75F18A